jgi:ketosteroid isomerase-like protein
VAAPDAEAMLRRMYAAFAARDVEATAGLMHPDVDWSERVGGRAAAPPTCSRTGGASSGRSTRSDAREVTERDDGRIAVGVRQVVRSLDGDLLADRRAVHVYALRDGLVERMDVDEG